MKGRVKLTNLCHFVKYQIKDIFAINSYVTGFNLLNQCWASMILCDQIDLNKRSRKSELNFN